MLSKETAWLLLAAVLLTTFVQDAICQSHPGQSAPAYLGFDRNNYPGDQNLKVLRETFSYTGYWLNAPPSARTNTWSGKRVKLESAGFCFFGVFGWRLLHVR